MLPTNVLSSFKKSLLKKKFNGIEEVVKNIIDDHRELINKEDDYYWTSASVEVWKEEVEQLKLILIDKQWDDEITYAYKILIDYAMSKHYYKVIDECFYGDYDALDRMHDEERRLKKFLSCMSDEYRSFIEYCYTKEELQSYVIYCTH